MDVSSRPSSPTRKDGTTYDTHLDRENCWLRPALAVGAPAFNRAARKLADEELIEIYYLGVPHLSAQYGYAEQLTDEDWDVCRGACEEIYALSSILRDAFSNEFSQ
jgi:hypothetical protein